MVLEVMHEHLRPREHVCHGQVVWLAVSKDDPPNREQRLLGRDLVPVVLELATPDDIEARMSAQSAKRRHLRRALRLCQQAHDQGGLLSNSDLSMLMGIDDSTIGQMLSAHERETGKVVPRRATLHDVGTSMTHKRIICRKRYLEGKESQQIARETFHSIEAVDRYLGQFDRVRHCRKHGLSPEQTAYTLSCSLALTKAYLDIDQELETQRQSRQT
jgi:hypothetical protein